MTRNLVNVNLICSLCCDEDVNGSILWLISLSFAVRNPKRKISVDDNILSIVSNEIEDTTSAATDVTSDVFHSIVNTLGDEDITIRSDDVDDEDNTFNIDTPDDMQDSIMERMLKTKRNSSIV